MNEADREFLRLVRNLLVFMLLAVGVLFTLDALGWIPPSPWDAILGMALGCACIVGAQITDRR